MKKLSIIVLAASAMACGNKEGASIKAGSAQTERYYAAIDTTFEGDSRAGYDELLKLAAEEPDTRAGRKARAVLQADDPLLYAALLGAGSAFVLPSGLWRHHEETVPEPSPTALGKLLAVTLFEQQQYQFVTEHHYQTPVAYPEGFEGQYVILWGPGAKGVTSPIDMPKERVEFLSKQASAVLAKVHLKPGVSKKAFLIAIAGDPDDDGELDLWTVDQDRTILHLADDAE